MHAESKLRQYQKRHVALLQLVQHIATYLLGWMTGPMQLWKCLAETDYTMENKKAFIKINIRNCRCGSLIMKERKRINWLLCVERTELLKPPVKRLYSLLHTYDYYVVWNCTPLHAWLVHVVACLNEKESHRIAKNVPLAYAVKVTSTVLG